MKKWILFFLIFIPYCIPYVYLSMMMDYSEHSVLGYMLMILMTGFLAFSGKRFRHLLAVLLGNLASAGCSLWLITRIPDADAPWDGYFKPFDGFHMVVLASVLLLIPQLLAIAIASRKKHHPKG